jgi:hypothetical protein
MDPARRHLLRGGGDARPDGVRRPSHVENLIPLDRILFLKGLATSAVSVWFTAWVIRSSFDLDLKLTRTEQIVRWLVIGVCIAPTLLRGPRYAYVRLIFGIVGVSFFAWPNLGHHVTSVFSRRHDA